MSRSVPHAPLTLAGEESRREGGPATPDLGQTLTLALLIHLALVWLLMRLPPAAPHALPPAGAPPLLVEFQPPKRQPLAAMRPFKFVDIPDEPEVSNPNASSVSDRSRRARAPLKPPAGHKPENEDPYTLGNAAERVMHAPAKAPAAAKGAGGTGPAPAAAAATPAAGAQAPPPPLVASAATAAKEGLLAAPPREPPPAGPGAGTLPPRVPGPGGRGNGAAPGDLLGSVPRVSEGDLLESFHNPGGISPMDIGTVSFDTAAIDWGPYAREMLKIIRHNWIDRMPPSARSGLKGVAVVHFRIARNGSVSEVTLVDSYGVRLSSSGSLEVVPGIRPFETTAQSAIEVSELPPLPDIFADPDVGVTIGFFYNLRPPR